MKTVHQLGLSLDALPPATGNATPDEQALGRARSLKQGEGPQAFGLYAMTSISTFASTISRASVVERAGLPFGK